MRIREIQLRFFFANPMDSLFLDILLYRHFLCGGGGCRASGRNVRAAPFSLHRLLSVPIDVCVCCAIQVFSL